MFESRQWTLRYRLDRGDCFGVSWLALGSVAIAETAARCTPDGIVIDLQHGLWDRRDFEHAVGVIPAGVPVWARVAENSAFSIGAALDAGAEAVIVPLVETAKQARAAVAHARFPPHGARSGGGIRPLMDFPGYWKAANRGVVVAVMIETARGVENARAIAAVEGVDMVFIGTGDLALSLGTFPGADPRHEQACVEVLSQCRAEWTPCGIFTMTTDQARQRRAEGFRMVVTANDADLVKRGFERATGEFRAATDAPRIASAGPQRRADAAVGLLTQTATAGEGSP